MNERRSSQAVTLRISVTDRCQMRCLYCMPPDGVRRLPHDDILTYEEIVRFVRVVKSRCELGKVRITGGEPLVRPGIVRLVELLASEGVDDLAMTTNGQRLAAMAADLKRAGLRRVNVSLDSLDEKTYAALSRGGDVRAVLEGIEAAIACGLAPVKVNTVLIRGANDDEITPLARWAIERGCEIRFLELMAIGWAKASSDELFVSSGEAQAALAQSFHLIPAVRRNGQTSRTFLATDHTGRHGTVGLVSSVTRPFCGGCRRLRLTSTGQLIACLARGDGPNVRALLRAPSAANMRTLGEIVADHLGTKTGRVSFDTDTPMPAIGG